MSWEVDCAVKVENMDQWALVNEVAERAVGRMSDSAGTGFGFRDMQWVFDTHAEAEAARKRLQACGLTFEYLQVSEEIPMPEETA